MKWNLSQRKNWAINEIVNPEDANRWETGIEEGINKAEEAAKDALTLSNKAKTEAIAEAASDAQTKANQAEANAISTAATDAATKADKAKTDAITAASADATKKPIQHKPTQKLTQRT